MRQAIEDANAADAEKKKKKSKKVDSGGLTIGGKELPIPDVDLKGLGKDLGEKISNVKIPGVSGDGGKGTGNIQDLAESGKRTAKKVWSNRNGRLAVIAVAALVVIMIAGNILVGMLGHTQNVPLAFEITDSALSIYKNSAYGSGYAWDAYVEVKNTGSENIYLSNLAFRVETDAGETVMTDQQLSVFPSILKPGEHGYIYNQFGSELVYEANTSKPIAEAYPGIANGSVGLVLRAAANANLAVDTPNTYSVVDNSVSITDGLDPGSKAMQCNVVNESGSIGANLTAVFVMYTDSEDGDDNLKCIGITMSRIGQIKPHETILVRMDPLNYVHSMRNMTATDWKMYVY